MHHNCGKLFSKEFYSEGEPQDNQTKLFEAMVSTRMFCMRCCHMHTEWIMRASRIHDDSDEDAPDTL